MTTAPKCYESSIEGYIYANCPGCDTTMRLGELWADLILNEGKDVPRCPDCEPDRWSDEADVLPDGFELLGCMGDELDPDTDSVEVV